MSRLEKILLIIIGLLILFVFFFRVEISIANEMDIKVSWDANDRSKGCNDVCVSYGAPRAEGFVLSTSDVSSYIVFTNKEFLEAECSFALVNTFKRSTLAVGQPVYTDRDYTITEIPSEFNGYNAIIVPNDQRAATDETGFLDFSVPSNSTVYIAWDSRYTTLPNWMAKFTNINKSLKTSNSNQPQMNIYALQYKDCFIDWQNIKFYVSDTSKSYGDPFYTLSQSYENDLSTPTEAIVKIECENYVKTNKYLMLRSGAMVGEVEVQSEDSDEVVFECNMERPDKTVLSMEQTATDYVFTWTDTGERTWRYQLQYSYNDPTTNRGSYKVLRTIDAPILTVSVPVEEIQGLLSENSTMWLTMVSITKPLIYSRWTDTDIQIDRYVPVTIQPVKNITIITAE